jgi:transcriptional regulator with XRE-family HTH domain
MCGMAIRSSVDDNLGAHIRAARMTRALTLEALAEKAGVSRSYLSNVERNVNSPTISTLRTILDALDVSLADLFRTVEEANRVVVRPSERVEIARTGNDDIRYELLTPNATSRIEMLVMYVAPGAQSGEEPHRHVGEEVGLILSGRLQYWVDGVEFDLQPGDAITFDSTRPHRYLNPGNEQCVSVWALTPPTF